MLQAAKSRKVADGTFDRRAVEFVEDVLPDKPLRSTFTVQIQNELSDNEAIVGHWLLDNNYFHTIIGGLVLLNTLMMGVEIDNQEWETFWIVNEYFFTGAFLVEMVLKMFFLRLRGYFGDRGNWLDFSLVILSLADLWVLPLIGSSVDLRSLTILRMLRLVRLVRGLRLLKHMKQLVLIVAGVRDAIRSTLWVGLLLGLVVYIFSIFCVGYIGKSRDRTDYPGYTQDRDEWDNTENMQEFNPDEAFGNMPRAMFTLFNLAIQAEWPEIVRPILIKQPHLVPVFIIYMMFVPFCVMNVIIGLIIESVMSNVSNMQRESAELERERKLRTLGQIEATVLHLDDNGDGMIDFEELAKRFSGEQMQTLLDQIALPRGMSCSEVLRMLDNDGDGALQVEEFVKAFFRLVDNDEFQRSCMVQLGMNEMKCKIVQLESAIFLRLDALDASVGRIADAVAGPGQTGSESCRRPPVRPAPATCQGLGSPAAAHSADVAVPGATEQALAAPEPPSNMPAGHGFVCPPSTKAPMLPGVELPIREILGKDPRQDADWVDWAVERLLANAREVLAGCLQVLEATAEPAVQRAAPEDAPRQQLDADLEGFTAAPLPGARRPEAGGAADEARCGPEIEDLIVNEGGALLASGVCDRPGDVDEELADLWRS